MNKICFAVVGTVLLISAFAHEYILIAHKFRVAKGDTLGLHLFVADGFNIELERPMQTAITKKFELLNENVTVNLLAETKEGSLPIVNRVADFDGLGVVHLERDYARITLPTKNSLVTLKKTILKILLLKKMQPNPIRKKDTAGI